MKFPAWLTAASPLFQRLHTYDRDTLFSDLIGGTVVAVMLVPQAMAYAMLAGLPPQVGLYASILPIILYALFGSSNALAVGPVAMVSLLVASGVSELAAPGSPEYISLCLTLALMVGLIQVLMAVFRFGFIVNFISHPVLKGFTSAAAIVIAFSQLKHLFGIKIESGDRPFETILSSLSAIPEANPVTLAIGLASCALLFGARLGFSQVLTRMGASKKLAATLPRFAPLVAVAVTATLLFATGWDQKNNVAIVGEIPSGLPGLAFPALSLESLKNLFPLALVIALVGFLESYSVAKALASRKREKVSADRELFGLGLADLGAAVSGGFPVTGGFSRSVVSQSAGVTTPLGSVFTAGLVAISVLFLADLFFYIPRAVLAAIILVAVVSLINLKLPFQLWKYSRPDALAWIITFSVVLLAGIETGILAGVCSTAVLLMWDISRPFVTKVGRVDGSEHFRNVDRFKVATYPGVIAFRIDASLIFANSPFVEDYVLGLVAEDPTVNKLLLIATGINEIDATGIELLHTLHDELKSGGVDFYLSDVKGPVTDRLQEAGFNEDFLKNHIFLSADVAMKQLAPPFDHPSI